MGDDLKKYEVHIGEVPIWYYWTIKEFIVHYCDDMHHNNKQILLDLLNQIEPKAKKDTKVVELKKRKVA